MHEASGRSGLMLWDQHKREHDSEHHNVEMAQGQLNERLASSMHFVAS